MDNRSVEILDKLKQCLWKGSLTANAFPQEDILEMIRAEHKQWLSEQFYYLEEYIGLYDILIDHAVENSSSDRLVDLLDEFLDDLYRIPTGVPEKLEGLRKRGSEFLSISRMEKARKVYAAYPYQSKKGESAFHGKGVVYTVITGNYDTLWEPEHISPKLDYVCFTDNKEQTSGIWDIRYIEDQEDLDNVRLARKYKILCHKYLPEYDYSIYVDGKMRIIGDISEYAAKYSKGSPMLCFPHFVRECAYQEADLCIGTEMDDAGIIAEQMNGYRQEEYPAHYGLIDSACLIRQHRDRELQMVMECWWKEVKEKSRRDQLSIGYACWKNNFHYDLCDLYIYENEYLHRKDHTESREKRTDSENF